MGLESESLFEELTPDIKIIMHRPLHSVKNQSLPGAQQNTSTQDEESNSIKQAAKRAHTCAARTQIYVYCDAECKFVWSFRTIALWRHLAHNLRCTSLVTSECNGVKGSNGIARLENDAAQWYF